MKTLLLAGWVLKENLFGIPYVYIAPAYNNQNANISFTDTSLEVDLKDVHTLSATQERWQKGRKAWAKKLGMKVDHFFPYSAWENLYGHRIHELGFNYSTYTEKTYYIECRGNLYVSKALRLTSQSDLDKDFSKLIHNFDCEAK